MTTTTNWQAEAERLRAERDEIGEQVAFVERHLGVKMKPHKPVHQVPAAHHLCVHVPITPHPPDLFARR